MSAEPVDRIREPTQVARLVCASGPDGRGGDGGRKPRARVPPLQVFTEEALRRLSDWDEPPTAWEAELSGPWQVIRLGDDYGVVQAGKEDAGAPLGRFTSRHLALLAAAALPGLGRGSAFEVQQESGEHGYPVRREGVDVGALRVFLADLGPALDLLETFLRSPRALALLLEAAGPTALARAGRALGQRLQAAVEE